MRPAHPHERETGIEYYVSETDGMGGQLKDDAADFRVEEIEGVALEPVNSRPTAFDHLVVRAELRGWDTYGFARRLARELGIHPEAIRWAGTKDKHAVTTQLFSIQGVDPGDVPNLPRATIEPVGRLGRGLTFGDLHGNRFTIRVRNADRPGAHRSVTEELTAFGGGTPGVPNYFGPQRFGSKRVITHLVGLAIIDDDWEAAVMRYLGRPSETEPRETQAARAYVEETRDWEGARERFPRGLDHERRLLGGLTSGDGYREALERLPSTLCRLFVHAAQSYAFNRILSRRLAHGLSFREPVVGDVVCFGTETAGLGTVPDPGRTQRVTADRVETIRRHARLGRAFVTAPLVGTETNVAEGEPGEIEREVFDEIGIQPSRFDRPDPFGSTGTRRAVLVATDVNVAEHPLTFRFALPSGSYATTLLREYLKVSPMRLG